MRRIPLPGRDSILVDSRGTTRIEGQRSSTLHTLNACDAPPYLPALAGFVQAAGSGVFRYQAIAKGMLSVGDTPFLSYSEIP